MQRDEFHTLAGDAVTAVTAEEMRTVDRIAVDEVGLTLTRMMEHAGRALAEQALAMAHDAPGEGPVIVLAGGGGNGGGGLACARHLANRDVPTAVVLDRAPDDVAGVPGKQLAILDEMRVRIGRSTDGLAEPALFVDALLGYGLAGEPRGRAATLIEWAKRADGAILSLDVPSGLDATTGETPGVAIHPDRTLTLALPKTGLTDTPGDLVLADLSIPAIVYDRAGIPYEPPFGAGFLVELQ